jgi:uroporphyrinogen III methyltransferase/synthase
MSATPLAGRRIVITRARAQAAGLADKLASLGAEVIEFPTIEIQPPGDPGPLDRAAASVSEYDWIIFTSANGVRAFMEHSPEFSAFPGRVCAIGPATRRAAEAAGLRVTLVPDEYVAESLVAAFSGEELAGKRILLPRAAVARDVVPDELRARGAQVDVVEAYRTVVPAGAPALARHVFGTERKPDWVTFTSSSTVTNFVKAAGVEALHGVRVASIGPVTSATARGLGIAVAVEAAEFTTAGLVAAIADFHA